MSSSDGDRRRFGRTVNGVSPIAPIRRRTPIGVVRRITTAEVVADSVVAERQADQAPLSTPTHHAIIRVAIRELATVPTTTDVIPALVEATTRQDVLSPTRPAGIDIGVALVPPVPPVLEPHSTLICFDSSLLVANQQAVASMVR